VSRPREPRFAVYGAGAIGCYFAAALSRAGYRTAVVARGRHREAIERNGIRVDAPEGSFTAYPESVTEDPSEIGPVDGVLLAVKAWQVPGAAQRLHRLLASHTQVLPLQNGVEAADQIAESIGRTHTLMGLCRIVCLLREPGIVRHVAVKPTVAIGEWENRSLSPPGETLAASLENAGIVVERPTDIRAALWQKLMFIAALSGVGAVSRSPVGDVRGCPATRELLVGLMEEVRAVAGARGVDLPEDVIGRTLEFVDAMAPQSTTSMQRDIDEAKPSELEAIVGVVVRSGQELDVATPMARFVYASLLPQEKRAQMSAHATQLT